MIKPSVLDAMVAAGCTAEQIAAAVKADQASASGAARQARYRARKAAAEASLVTQSDDGDVTSRNDLSPKKENSPTPPKEKTTPISSEAKASSRCERDFFEDFWQAYPRREGPNPKKPAREKFARLIAKGHSPELLIEAVQTLATEHPTPTRFVPQALTWLSQERFEVDAPAMLSGDEFCAEDWPNTRFLVLRFRQEHQTDPPRAVQGGKAGYLIPAAWVANSRQTRAANA